MSFIFTLLLIGGLIALVVLYQSEKKKVDELAVETHWTLKAEAIQYRESLQIERSSENSKRNESREGVRAV